MSFRKMCKKDEEERKQYVKVLQDACDGMRDFLHKLNGEIPVRPVQESDTDESYLEDRYKEDKKIDDQFLRQKEVLKRLDEYRSQSNQYERFDILRHNFSVILGMLLSTKPALKSFSDLKGGKIANKVHDSMDLFGLSSFYEYTGEDRFPNIISKLKRIIRQANEKMFDHKALNLNLSFHDKLEILKIYYELNSSMGTKSSPLRIYGAQLLKAIDNYLCEHRNGYKRSKEMKRILQSLSCSTD